jgi:hypothetical protein
LPTSKSVVARRWRRRANSGPCTFADQMMITAIKTIHVFLLLAYFLPP